MSPRKHSRRRTGTPAPKTRSRSRRFRNLLIVILALSGAGTATLYGLRMARPLSGEAAEAWMLASIPAGTLVVVEPGILPELPDSAAARPFHVVTLPGSEDPALSAPFYRLSWFRDFGFLAVNQKARERQAREPTRYPDQLAFYRQIEAQWTPAATFSPDSLRGPEIRIFRNPAPGVDSPPPTGPLVQGFQDASPSLVQPFLLAMGDAYASARRLERASDVFIALTQICPEYLLAYERFAMTCLYMGRNAEAVAACESYLRRDPTNADISLLQAVLYARSGHLPEAEAAARRTLEIDPGNERAREFLGTLTRGDSGP